MSDLSVLTNMVARAHEHLASVLNPGDLAVDLTAGNGHDTLFLYRRVGPNGRVVAFDIQGRALEVTASRLRKAGAEVAFSPLKGTPSAGVHLVHDSHCRLGHYLTEPPRAIIANFGYLPGGDPSLKTEKTSTIEAMSRALELLAHGGRLAVVAYAGHPGGREEGESVAALFRSLSPQRWRVMRLEAINRSEAPYLLVAEKR